MTALHPSATARARFGLVLTLLFAAPPAPLQAQPSPDGFQEPAGANGPDLRLDAARPPEANAPAGGSPPASRALGLQAVTPAGLQFAGAQDGPTVFSPAFALFHALDNGFAVQGFVGKHLQVSSTGYVPVPVQRSLQYGLAIQRPLVAA